MQRTAAKSDAVILWLSALSSNISRSDAAPPQLLRGLHHNVDELFRRDRTLITRDLVHFRGASATERGASVSEPLPNRRWRCGGTRA